MAHGESEAVSGYNTMTHLNSGKSCYNLGQVLIEYHEDYKREESDKQCSKLMQRCV